MTIGNDAAAVDTTIALRPAAADDAAAIAELSGELGYPADAATMRLRLERMIRRGGHAIFVACRHDRIVGWIHVAVAHHLQAAERGEIGGLVVADGERGAGVGARLLAQAERWAAQQGLATVVVRSQIARERAHRFYEREGYSRTKTSAVFTKLLTRS